jgi:hypothetical protein
MPAHDQAMAAEEWNTARKQMRRHFTQAASFHRAFCLIRFRFLRRQTNSGVFRLWRYLQAQRQIVKLLGPQVMKVKIGIGQGVLEELGWSGQEGDWGKVNRALSLAA